MNHKPNPSHSDLATQLRHREADLRAILKADESRALHSATGNAEVSDFKDVAALGSDASLEEVKVGHAHMELSLVLAAQRRLAEGSYGVCEGCGEPIDKRRLLALPASTHCTACQAINESKSAARGSGASST